jgi:hypothetical protein
MPGYEVVRSAVPRERVDAALRLLHGDILRRGIDAQQLGGWLWAMHWFPHLRFEDEISALAEALPEPCRARRFAFEPPDAAAHTDGRV